jgi:hypothetical protein
VWELKAVSIHRIVTRFTPTPLYRGKVMAKWGRPKSVTTTKDEKQEGGETTSGYFRRVFKENPKLLVSRSNDELLRRWLADHPGHKTVPPNVQNHLSHVKSGFSIHSASDSNWLGSSVITSMESPGDSGSILRSISYRRFDVFGRGLGVVRFWV